MGKNIYTFVKAAFGDFVGSLSIITLLLVVSPILILGTDLFYNNFSSIDQSPPRKLGPGEMVEQTVAVGRGQTLVLEARSNASLILIIISGHSMKDYQKNPRPEFMLYFHEGSTFWFEKKFHNYTVVFLLWDNSQSNNTDMIGNVNFSIRGLDLDLMTSSSLFLIVGIFNEIFMRLTRIISKKKTNRFLKQHLNYISSLISMPSETQTGNKFPSYYRMAFIILRKEWSILSSDILLGVLFVSFLVVNPSAKLLLLEPSNKTLAIGLIEVLSEGIQFLWIIWAFFIALVGSGIWKTKQDTSELRNDLSLPLNKQLYAIVGSILLGLSCSFCLSVSYLAAILINYLRFIQVPNYSLLVILLLLIFTWQIVILLASSTICLQFPSWPLFRIVLLVFMIIFTVLAMTDMVVPNTLLLPLPNKLEDLVRLLLTNDLGFDNLFSLVGGSVVLVCSIFFLYIQTIERLQIE